MFANYDPKKIVVTWRGILFQGPADGTFCTLERTEDGFEMAVGAAGDVTRVRNNNRTGSMTYTMKQSSPTNDQLAAFAAEDELFGTAVGALLVKDLGGTTIAEAAQAWIRKIPGVQYSDSEESREWVLDVAELEIFVGGSVT